MLVSSPEPGSAKAPLETVASTVQLVQVSRATMSRLDVVENHPVSKVPPAATCVRLFASDTTAAAALTWSVASVARAVKERSCVVSASR